MNRIGQGGVPLAGADRDRGRRRIRRGARLAATETPRAAAAGRSSAPAGVRAFARDVYCLIWGAERWRSCHCRFTLKSVSASRRRPPDCCSHLRPLATALIAPIAGRLADRMIPGLLGSIGLLVMGSGLVLVATGIGDSAAGFARLAPRDLRPGLRVFPVAQQSGDHRQRAARAKRRGGRPAILRTADRPVVRDGAGGGRAWTGAAGTRRRLRSGALRR